MSDWINHELDVLASSAAEINHVAVRLHNGSPWLTNWVANRLGGPVSDITELLNELLEFQIVPNLGPIHSSMDKMRRFRNSCNDKYRGIIHSHLIEVSSAFPSAIFLLTYRSVQCSYSGKWVCRAGEIVHELRDSDQKAQGVDWALLDIFAPFIAEYEAQLEFGSLWGHWLDAVISKATDLKAKQISDRPRAYDQKGKTWVTRRFRGKNTRR